jgi:hypothetical protein
MSKTIAGLMGPTLLAMGIGMLLNLGSFAVMVEQVSHDIALIFFSGVLLLVAGLAIVRSHHVWTGWPVLVTVLGWLAIIGGLARLFFPTQLAAMAANMGQHQGFLIVAAIILLLLGGFLSFKAYSRD